MDAQHLKQVLQSTAAGTLLLLSADLVIAEHLIQYDPDRPQVSAAASPIWGYHRPCWRRFPQTPPCDHCDPTGLSTGDYLPSQFPSQPSFYAPQSSVYTPQSSFYTPPSSVYTPPSDAHKPISVLPGGTNAQTSPGPSAVDSTLLPTPQPQQSPVPAGGRPLPPLPGPPTSITPIPDPGPMPQQSRHTQPSLWLPSNGMNGSRYGQIPVSTISSSVTSTVISGAALSGNTRLVNTGAVNTGAVPAITGPATMTPSGLILPTGNRISVPGQGRYAQPGR